ncbi:UMP kinase [[Eubacterium] cellulosolvens]
MKLVIKIGGHLFPSELNPARIDEFASILKGLQRKNHKIIVVTGGGVNARLYIRAARKLGSDESYCDDIGISFARLNAKLLISALGDDSYPRVAENTAELRTYNIYDKIIVMGGLQPGQSTNAVAAIAAEIVGADLLVNGTDVEGVYTDDPKIYQDAKKLDEVTIDQLLDIIVKSKSSAGGYKLLDPVAVKIIERSKIPTIILDLKDPKNLIRIIEGNKIGTRIRF